MQPEDPEYQATSQEEVKEEQENIMVEDEKIDQDILFTELYLQSSPNEHALVLNDLRLLGPHDPQHALIQHLNDTWAVTEVISEYDLNNNEAEKEGSESNSTESDAVNVTKTQMIVSRHNWVSDNLWYEPGTGDIYTVDPETLETFETGEKVEALVDEEKREAIAAYAQKTLNPKSSSWGAYLTEDGMTLAFMGSRLEPRNLWSGRWRSEWTLDGNWELTGNILAFVHYFEEGNIQLRAEKNVKLPLQTDTPIKSIISKIEETETAFQVALNEAYCGLQQDAFKRLRRQLPITRTKMDWSKIGAYGLGTELQSRYK